ncbi:MAG: ATP-binding protein [Thermoleophilaceae bacterium]
MASPRLWERDAELDSLGDLIGAAARGHGRVVVLAGPAGIGKTRLVAEVCSRAAELGMETLLARGSELERDVPWGIARSLLEPALARRPGRERSAALSGAAGLAAPILGRAPATLAGGRAAEGTGAAVHGLYWLVSGLAERAPLLVAVDDAHWSDTASLRWIAYLARRVEELPILLLVSYRPAEPGVDTSLVDTISEEPAAQTLVLAPLTVDATRKMIEDRLEGEPDPAFCDACHGATGGNAFLLHELIGQLAADDVEPTTGAADRLEGIRPETISRAVLLRLRRLPEAARALVLAGAVLGSAATLARAAELAGVDDEDEAAAAADALAAAEILAFGRPLEFVHPLVRAAVYHDIPAAQRARMHARAARMLARDGLGLEEQAAHLLAAEPAGDAWCADTLGRAAAAASELGAPEAAAAYLRRALEEPPPRDRVPALVWELGRAEAAFGAPAAATLERALQLAPDAAQRAEIALELSFVLRISSDFSRALGILKPILEELPPDTPLSERVEGELINVAMLSGESGARRVAAERMTRFADAEAVRNARDARLLASLAVSATGRNRPATVAAELAERALAAAQSSETDPAVTIYAADVLAYCDRYAPARAVAEELARRGSETGSAAVYGFALALRSRIGYREGALREAESDARSCMDIYGDWPVDPLDPLGFLVDPLIEQGRFEEAARILEQAPAGSDGGRWDTLVVRNSRGRLRLARGDAKAALDDMLHCGRELVRAGALNPALMPWRSTAALAHLSLDARGAARELADEELSLAREFGAPRAIGIALRCTGLVADRARRIELLEESVAVLDGSGARLEHAKSLYELGAALRRAGRRGVAQPPLREALDLAVRCGAERLAAHAREELAAAGARPRRDALRGRDALTATELRVCRMAAEGMTNREIAQALFVTLRTVETHLTHAYPKLGIGSRAELSAALDAV